MSRLDFSGEYGDYTGEPQRLGVLMGVGFDLCLKVNVTEDTPGDDPISETPELEALTAILAEDIKFYEQYAGR
jgi:hypothetical protein